MGQQGYAAERRFERRQHLPAAARAESAVARGAVEGSDRRGAARRNL